MIEGVSMVEHGSTAPILIKSPSNGVIKMFRDNSHL